VGCLHPTFLSLHISLSSHKSLKMKYISVLFALTLCAVSFAFTQNCNGRYLSEIFTTTTMQTVTYSDTFGLDMNIYIPDGDTVQDRPLLILCFGGSFVGGDKTNPSMIAVGESYAKRGYVTATIDYRLGDFAMFFDSLATMDVVVKAIGDGKAAVRYFRKSFVDSNNPYGIDTSDIFIGGNSAGAILSYHVGFLNNMSEVPFYMTSIINSNGGINGNSGNDGYSSKVKAVTSWAGGIKNAPLMIDSNDVPVIMFHGDADNVVPYNFDKVYSNLGLPGLQLVTIFGSNASKPFLDAANVTNDLITFPGDGHVPWDADAVKMDTLMTKTSRFFYPLLQCNNPISNLEELYLSKIDIYPNPSNGLFTIKSAYALEKVIVSNLLGEEIINEIVDDYKINLGLTNKAAGIYTVSVLISNHWLTKKIVIE